VPLVYLHQARFFEFEALEKLQRLGSRVKRQRFPVRVVLLTDTGQGPGIELVGGNARGVYSLSMGLSSTSA